MRHPHTLVAAASGIVLSVAAVHAQSSNTTTRIMTAVVRDTVPPDTTKTPPDTTKTPKSDTTKTPAPKK